MAYLLSALGGLLVGASMAWLVVAARSGKRAGMVEELRKQVARSYQDVDTLRTNVQAEQAARVKADTELSQALLRLEEERKVLEEARTRLTDAFKAVASDTLNQNAASFLRLARESFDKIVVDAKGDLGARQEAIQGLVKPLSESLKQFDEHVRAIEKNRQEGYAGLATQLKSVTETQQQLRTETANLVTALRRPEVRGRWGELTLRRVVELAEMSPHCDFCEQVSVDTDEGRLRPDMIVNLPADRQIVVDSKAPLDAYLDATQAGSEDERKLAMHRHAAQVRSHLDRLASKTYWDQFPRAPEFVIMFIAGESFFGAAVEVDPALIEKGLQKRVVIATPATLIALLHAVAYGWRQEQIAKNTERIGELGRQLFERMGNLVDYVADIGRHLEKATEAYNRSVASLERRVLVSARQFKDLGVASTKEIPEVDAIEVSPRLPSQGSPREEQEGGL